MNIQIPTQQRHKTLLDLLQFRAQEYPNKVAYTYLKNGETAEGSLTYGELDQRARLIAAKLMRLNGQNERAILLFQPSLEYIAAFFGCLYAGVTAVPAYPPHPRKPMTRIKAILDDAQPVFALTSSDIFDKLQKRVAEDPVLSAIHWLATDTIQAETDAETDAAEADQWQRPEGVAGDTLAFLQYTSGSTSTPKGVMVSHGNLLSTMEDMYRPWGHSTESVMVTWLPIFHDLGLIYGILTPLYGAYHCILMDPVAFLQKPLRWLQAISDFGGTHSHAPNFAYELCLQKISDEERDALDLSSWEVTLNAAEPVRLDTIQKFTERFAPCGFKYETFCAGYGLAEASLKVSAQPIGLTPISRRLDPAALEQHQLIDSDTGVDIVGCGVPAIEADIRIVNPETKAECLPDEVGEIWVQSDSIAQGYWNRPEATAETFDAHIAHTGEGPYMRTGDLGFIWKDELFINGRIKDLLIIRGRNIYPQDVELVMERSHEALRPGCGAAFSVVVNNLEQLVVVQEIKRTYLRNFDEDEVLTAVRRAISTEFEIQPHTIVLLRTSSVLKTSSGKIQRQGNKRAFLADELKVLTKWKAPTPKTTAVEASSQPHPSKTQITNWVSHWLAQRLDVPIMMMQPTIPFVDLGLDSVMAVELAQALNEWLPVQFSIEATLAWNYPTIDTLSGYLINLLEGNAQSEPEVVTELINSETKPDIAIDDLDDLDDLSEDEVAALLAQELAMIQNQSAK